MRYSLPAASATEKATLENPSTNTQSRNEILELTSLCVDDPFTVAALRDTFDQSFHHDIALTIESAFYVQIQKGQTCLIVCFIRLLAVRNDFSFAFVGQFVSAPICRGTGLSGCARRTICLWHKRTGRRLESSAINFFTRIFSVTVVGN